MGWEREKEGVKERNRQTERGDRQKKGEDRLTERERVR